MLDRAGDVVLDRAERQPLDRGRPFEPSGHATARYVMDDIDCHGTTIPAGSPILLL